MKNISKYPDFWLKAHYFTIKTLFLVKLDDKVNIHQSISTYPSSIDHSYLRGISKTAKKCKKIKKNVYIPHEIHKNHVKTYDFDL